MRAPPLANLFDHLTRVPPIWHVLWAGLACLSVALFVLSWTRWGQSKPMHKCAVLSLLAHVLLACFATTVRIVTSAESSDTRAAIHVALLSGEEGTTDERSSAAVPQPWEGLQKGPLVRPEVPNLERPPVEDSPEPITLEESSVLMEVDASREPFVPPLPDPVVAEVTPPADPLPMSEQQDRLLGPVPIEVPEQEAAAPHATDPALTRPTLIVPSPAVEEMTDLVTPEMETDDWLATSPLAQVMDNVSPAELLPPVEEPLLEDVQWSPPQRISKKSPQENSQRAPADAPSTYEAADAAPLAPSLPNTEGSGPQETSVERPSVYRHRHPHERARLVQKHGGTAETEAAVQRALVWLARAQSLDGRWDAMRHGAGRESAVYGHDRQGAGAQADAGITGLALLAFLGAGHTQVEGSYQPQVQKGLDYLIRSQGQDGNLGGGARLYARMYCHAMAAFALSEAYAMTGDAALAGPVRRALSYTISAQHSGGGWRYRPGDPGDTSQLGWQLMALRSAELAGMAVPEQTWRRAGEFLQSVSRGRSGGLAAYQQGTGVSRAMSAEATYCKLLLVDRFHRLADMTNTCEETAEYLRSDLPGAGQSNLYYWYYATLLLHLRQHDHRQAADDWQRWNEALQRTLLASQNKSGPLEGAWGSDTTWGGYGGRVYTTALAALCLETYYRYLPFLEIPANRTAIRPGLLHRRAFDTRTSPGKIE